MLTQMALQVFQFSHRRFFTPMTSATTTLLTHEFQLIAPYQLLSLLSVQPTVTAAQIELKEADMKQWMSMKSEIVKFQKAFTKFKREPKN